MVLLYKIYIFSIVSKIYFLHLKKKELAYLTSSLSSQGKQVSTRASSALLNSSTFSALLLAFVNGPAKRHSPPKPQLCK